MEDATSRLRAERMDSVGDQLNTAETSFAIISWSTYDILPRVHFMSQEVDSEQNLGAFCAAVFKVLWFFIYFQVDGEAGGG